MKILVVGGGGREHAIVWKLKQSKKVGKIYCMPGNAGIAEIAECINIKAIDIDKIVEWCKQNPMDMVMVAPDDPLALGLVDKLQETGARVFGPSKAAARIESSKAFSKSLMKKYGIPTAEFEVFSDAERAKHYLKTARFPLVVKADGLALGKGVIICNNLSEATKAVEDMMQGGVFGKSGSTVVIEEFLKGFEVSVLAFTDGKTVVPMVSSQDHKRALDGDKGLNTGGMGTFSPSLKYTAEHAKAACEKIFVPTIKAMEKEGCPFSGVIYFGLMIDGNDIRVLEYNARFGDPETQVVLPRLKTDLVDIFSAVIDKKLDKINIEWCDAACVCVVMASGGYPEKYTVGKEIKIPDNLDRDIVVFHAGTARGPDGTLVTNGGRVLGVTAVSGSIESARDKAYAAVNKISFESAHFRRDIALKDKVYD